MNSIVLFKMSQVFDLNRPNRVSVAAHIHAFNCITGNANSLHTVEDIMEVCAQSCSGLCCLVQYNNTSVTA